MVIKENDVIGILKKLADKMNGIFTETYGLASIYIDNTVGKGTIKAFETYSGISSLVFDIRFSEEVFFERSNQLIQSIHCLYCLEGFFYHKFKGSTDFDRIQPYSSVIFSSDHVVKDLLAFPAEENIKVCVIFITDPSKELEKGLRPDFRDFIEFIRTKTLFNYRGSVNPKSAEFIKILLENKDQGVVGRLLCEAAILNALAFQINHIDPEDELVNQELTLLTKDEMNRILEMARHLEQNLGNRYTIQELQDNSGLNPKKLQSGFQRLFGVSVNNFMINARLEYARELLETSDDMISEVVYKTGISSRSYFTKIFKKRFGLTPSDYKELFVRESVVYELSYRSEAIMDLSKSDIENILETSRRNNQILGITGCLVFDGNSFFQILEGNKQKVLDTYYKIKNDKRHHYVNILWQGYKKEIYFKDWDLALIYENAKDTKSIPIADQEIEYLIKGDLNLNSDSKVFWEKIRSVFYGE